MFSLLCLMVVFITRICCLIQPNLTLEYYKLKSVHVIIIFSCNNDLKFLEDLNKNNIYITVYNINEINSKETDFVMRNGQQGFVLDTECANQKLILDHYIGQELFFDKYKWLIFAKNKTLLKELENMHMNVNAEVTVALKTSETVWKLLDVYNPGYKHGGKLKIEDISTWSLDTNFNFSKTIYIPKYIRRNDMSGIQFKGMVVLTHNYKGELLDYLYNNKENKSIDNFARPYFLLFDHTKDIYNFTFTTNQTKMYGTMGPNGSFNGLVGALQRREVDVGLTPIYYKIDRIPFVDYLVPTYLMKCRFIFLHPKPALTIRGSFFSPLSNVVWICTWGIMIILAILIHFSFKYEWKLERMQNDVTNYTEHDWSYIALLIFGGICQQDVPRVPNLYSSRCVVFISVFFTYMLYQFYSGGIVSSLLSEPPKTIRNLQDLLHSQLQIGVEDIVYERDYFDQTTDPVAKELYKSKVANKKNGSDAFYDIITGMDLVKRGEFAFQTDTGNGYAIITEDYSNELICQLGEVQLYPNQYTVGVVQQDSPFREMFVYSFQRMVEAGLVHRQRTVWTARKPECIQTVDSSTIFVGIKEFFPALLFFFIGIIISLIFFLAEFVIYNKKNKNKILEMY